MIFSKSFLYVKTISIYYNAINFNTENHTKLFVCLLFFLIDDDEVKDKLVSMEVIVKQLKC